MRTPGIPGIPGIPARLRQRYALKRHCIFNTPADLNLPPLYLLSGGRCTEFYCDVFKTLWPFINLDNDGVFVAVDNMDGQAIEVLAILLKNESFCTFFDDRIRTNRRRRYFVDPQVQGALLRQAIRFMRA